jgi:hypothetical protein
MLTTMQTDWTQETSDGLTRIVTVKWYLTMVGEAMGSYPTGRDKKMPGRAPGEGNISLTMAVTVSPSRNKAGQGHGSLLCALRANQCHLTDTYRRRLVEVERFFVR